MAELKKKFNTIDEYINNLSENDKKISNELRQTIKNAAPEAEEAISYQMPTFKLNGNLVHFAVFKNHLGFYPTPTGITAFQDELSAYKTSKGAIQFPKNQPLPLSLISKIVAYRVKENLERKKKKLK